jgi:hypothetical protein
VLEIWELKERECADVEHSGDNGLEELEQAEDELTGEATEAQEKSIQCQYMGSVDI